MDLGLGSLSDDQLLELLQQACGELAARDHYVRTCAQHTIVSQAEKLKLMREGIAFAVEAVKQEYKLAVFADILAEVRRLAASGQLRPLSPEEEAAMIPAANGDALLTIEREIGERRAAIAGGQQRFVLAISGGRLEASVGEFRMACHCTTDLAKIEAIGQRLYEFLH